MADKRRFPVPSLDFPVKRIPYYLKIWLLMSKNSFMVYINQKLLFGIFLFGKVFRFGFFILFIYFLVKGADKLAGYSVNQTVFFFLTFNLVDILGQFLYREVYRFRPMIVSGDFDLILLKPFNALFRVLLGGSDVIDLVTIPPLLFAVFWVGRMLNPTSIQAVLYLLLVANALVISTAFHIAVISMGIITLEIDHTVMIFRDMLNLGRLPVDIYREPIRSVLTYLIPVGIMITLPAKALMGLVTPAGILVSFAVGVVAVFAAVRFWNYALRFYTSASS
jgi:ABC-2 type transport system permease protein